jgi:hypothetical protein
MHPDVAEIPRSVVMQTEHAQCPWL